MGWLNKHKVSKSTLFYLAVEKKAKRQVAAREEPSLALPLRGIRGDYKRYFAEA
jgi:hypothetical protein